MGDESVDRAFTSKVLTSLAGTGVLGVVAAGMLAVANDSRIAINIAEQHGEEILMLRGELTAVRIEMLQRTENRYTAKDAANHEKYMDRRLLEIEKKLNELSNEGR